MTPSALSNETPKAAPICVVQCDWCAGSGDSGDEVVHEAPATWDDPGYREVEPVPCSCCGGTGYMEVDAP